MLVAIQFPLADSRPFLQDEGGKLSLPAWPLARPNRDFVRSSGAVAERRRGGLGCLPYEHLFSYGHHALRMPDSLSHITLGEGQAMMNPEVAFRRFFHDGCAAARFEIGVCGRAKGPKVNGASVEEVLKLVRDLLELPVKVSRPQTTTPTALGKAGPRLANHYRLATTEPGTDTPGWSLSAGTPLIVIEYSLAEIASIPALARPVELPAEAGPAKLHHVQFEWTKNERIGVWLFGRNKEANPAFVRGLRLCLFRLHAERECLKQILWLLAAKQLTVEPRSQQSEDLQQYLLEGNRRLSSRKWFADESVDTRYVPPNTDFLDAAYAADDMINPGMRLSLLSELSHIRGNLLRAIQALTAPAPQAPTTVYVYAQANSKVVVAGTTGDIYMDKNISIGAGAQVGGSVVAADAISNSFNTIENSKASDDLKSALTELAKLVDQMTKQLPPDQAANAAKDLKALTEEATSEKPRQKWYELSAEGLIDAAKAVGSLAAPVATAVKTVLALLV